MGTNGWEPVPYRMRMALHRRQRRGALLSEGVICEGFHLSGTAMDADRLNRAFALAVLLHPALRTRFRFNPAFGPQQQIGDPWQDVLREVRVDGSATDVVARAWDHMVGPGMDAFDLTAGRLLRPVLFTNVSTEHVLVVSVDHTSCDGLSFSQLLADVTAAYDDFASAEATRRRPSYTLVDYAHAETAYLDSPEGTRLRQAWRERLNNGFPEMVLVKQKPWNELTRDGGQLSVTLIADEFHEFQRAAGRMAVTPYMYAVARLFEAMLPSILSGDWSFIAPLAARLPGAPSTLIGNLASLAPVTVRRPDVPELPDLVRAVREGIVWALRHQVLPAEQILADVAPDRLLISDFRQIFISGQHRRPLAFDGVTARQLPSIPGYAMFDLSLWVTTSDSDLTLVAIHRSELLDRPLVEGWLAHIANVS